MSNDLLYMDLPNSQNATHTLKSAPSNFVFNLDQNTSQLHPGEPGMGSIAYSQAEDPHDKHAPPSL